MSIEGVALFSDAVLLQQRPNWTNTFWVFFVITAPFFSVIKKMRSDFRKKRTQCRSNWKTHDCTLMWTRWQTLDFISVNVGDFQRTIGFFFLSLYLIMFMILIYVAFRCLTALGPPFFSPKDRSKIKLRPGREASSAIFMSAVKRGSSRSINISFAFNRRSNNVHTVIGSLKILFFHPQTPFYSPPKNYRW